MKFTIKFRSSVDRAMVKTRSNVRIRTSRSILSRYSHLIISQRE
jgi:hypothetical protein